MIRIKKHDGGGLSRGQARSAALWFLLAACHLITGWGAGKDHEEVRVERAPFLWRVDVPGAVEPSWLFGTIHLGDPETLRLAPAAEEAFTGSRVLITEISFDPALMTRQTRVLLRTDGGTLSQSLDVATRAALERELRAIRADLDAEPFEEMATWAVAILLPLLPSQLAGETSLDQHLWRRAKRAGMLTDALETVESQTRALRDLPEESQRKILNTTLSMLSEAREAKIDALDELREAYRTGDADALWQLVHADLAGAGGDDKELGRLIVQGMIEKRDEEMAAKLAKRWRETPNERAFVAVGAAHMIGPRGLPARLRDLGFQVTRVVPRG